MTTLQSQIWTSLIPLHITLSPSLSTSTTTSLSPPPLPYIVHLPRLSYLPLLLPRLSTFFSTPLSSFTHEGIELRSLPVGLLVDLYAPALPWRIEVGDGWGGGGAMGAAVADGFMNSVKEADFIRNGSAKGIMSMSKDDSAALWNSVKDSDLNLFLSKTRPLLNPASPLKHIPLRIYIPQPDASTAGGSFKAIQGLVPPRLANREPQTLGTALNLLLPTLFPSRRDPILANAILHGAPVPFAAPLEELMRECAYADGWLGVVVVMM